MHANRRVSMHAWDDGGWACLAKEVSRNNQPDGVIGSKGNKGQLKFQGAREENEGLRHQRNGSNWQGFNDQTCPPNAPLSGQQQKTWPVKLLSADSMHDVAIAQGTAAHLG